MKQITFQNIVKDLDVYEWLNEIGNGLRMQDIHVSLGFSYLCRKTTATGEDITYTWTAPSMALEKTNCSINKGGMNMLIDSNHSQNMIYYINHLI